MNRLYYTIMVLTVTSCCGCSSEAKLPESSSHSDIPSRESVIIIPETSAKIYDKKKAPEKAFKLTADEKEFLSQANKQVQSIIVIIKNIVDTDTASTSLKKLCDARNTLQNTRTNFSKKSNNRRRIFLLFASDEGQLLQQAMWNMKNELHRLESDKEIHAILTDGMTNEPETIVETTPAADERKKYTVTASNVSAESEKSSKETLIVSETPAP